MNHTDLEISATPEATADHYTHCDDGDCTPEDCLCAKDKMSILIEIAETVLEIDDYGYYHSSNEVLNALALRFNRVLQEEEIECQYM